MQKDQRHCRMLGQSSRRRICGLAWKRFWRKFAWAIGPNITSEASDVRRVEWSEIASEAGNDSMSRRSYRWSIYRRGIEGK